MFGWEFPPFNSGGLGVACFGLTRALAQDGLNVIFVLPKFVDLESGHIKLRFADSSINLKPVNSLLSPYLTMESYRQIKNKFNGSLYGQDLISEVFRYAANSKDIVESTEFEIIHAHDWLSFPAAIEAKKMSGKPLVVHIHATEFDRTGGSGVNQTVYEIEKEGMNQADKVIAVSNFTKDIIVEKYQIPEEKVEVVHNGVDIQDFPQVSKQSNTLKSLKDQGIKIVLFAGRITLQKGPDYFLKAAKKVLEYNPNVFFVVAGDGDMKYQMVEQSVELGISGKIMFTGFLRGEELHDVFKCADLFVLPSVSEPFGITPLESLVNGTPVLISKQSGVSEVLSHALKADFWDIEEMTDKILSVINNESLQQDLQKNGTEEVKKFAWKNAAKKVENIYKSLLRIM